MNVSKPLFISVILLGSVSGLLISHVFNVMAAGGHYRGNPLHEIWEAVTELQTEVDALEERVQTLEAQSLPEGFATAPAYDSGWVFMGDPYPDPQTLYHNLGTTDVLVYIIGRESMDEPPHNKYNGGTQIEMYWDSLNTTHIRIYGRYGAKFVRVMLWKISEP